MSVTAERHELSTTRLIAAPPATVYRVWTERLGEWWAPAPYTTPDVTLDLRAGGRAMIGMQAPDGTAIPNEGVILEIEPSAKIVLTDAFRAGWVPQTPGEVMIFTFEAEGDATRYTARVRHWSAEALQANAAMGCAEGWAITTGKLAALAEAEAGEQ